MKTSRMGKAAFSFYKWLGFVIAVIISAISAVLGYLEGTPSQLIILYTVAIFGSILWGWYHLSVRWKYNEDEKTGLAEEQLDEEIAEDSEYHESYISYLIKSNKFAIIGILAMIIAFVALAFAMDNFFEWRNVLSLVVFFLTLLILIITNSFAKNNKSALMGLAVLIGLFIMGSLIVDGFISTLNLKSMLLFASFLGLACIGQTLVVLLGGLDLSVSFVIGAANIGLMYLINLGIPPWICIIAVLLLGIGVGLINGLLSFRLQGQALILTLGVGFIITGLVQALTTIGSDFGGSVFGVVPKWLSNIAATNGTIFGISIPPIVVIWVILSIVLIVALKNTTWGRNLYAVGGNRTTAARLSISERTYWVGVFTIGGFVSALTGVLLLGWSGGGFVGVGGPYLFQTIAAVVVGGTSLLGGKGLGLGLALAKRLAESLEHSINSKSTLGSGSCFSVTVDIAENNTENNQEESFMNIMNLSGTNILLVEDDMDVLKATKQLLESWGCKVKTARNKDEVMNFIKENPYDNPDIILADNRLPGDASGIDITYLIQEKLQASIPCVIMTGDVERNHVQSIIDQGFPVLLKPIQPAKFRAMLSHLIQA